MCKSPTRWRITRPSPSWGKPRDAGNKYTKHEGRGKYNKNGCIQLGHVMYARFSYAKRNYIPSKPKFYWAFPIRYVLKCVLRTLKALLDTFVFNLFANIHSLFKFEPCVFSLFCLAKCRSGSSLCSLELKRESVFKWISRFTVI